MIKNLYSPYCIVITKLHTTANSSSESLYRPGAFTRVRLLRPILTDTTGHIWGKRCLFFKIIQIEARMRHLVIFLYRADKKFPAQSLASDLFRYT